MTKKEILKKLLKSFEEEDKKEPFLDREYVEETKRIYNGLIISDVDNYVGKATYDIVNDIFRVLSIEGHDI